MADIDNGYAIVKAQRSFSFITLTRSLEALVATKSCNWAIMLLTLMFDG